MDNKTAKNLMMLVTYAAVLILLIINVGPIMQSLWAFIMLLKPLFIGIAIAFILNQPCMSIQKLLSQKLLKSQSKSLTRGLAIAVTYLLFLLLFALLISFVIPQLIDSIRVFLSNIGTYLNNSQELVNKLANFLKVAKIDLSSVTDRIFNYINGLASSVTDVLSGIINITTGIISFIVTLVISMVFSIYLLAGKEKLLSQSKKVFGTYLPQKIYQKCSYVYHIVTDVFHKYVVGQLIEACILGALCFIGMLIFRFEYPVLISVIIGVSTLIPALGAYMGGFISFFLLLVIDPMKAVWFLAFLLVLQQFEGNIIYPRVVGSSLGLPNIWVLLAIIVGVGTAGPLGILLGVPIVTVLYILFKNDVHNREARVSGDGSPDTSADAVDEYHKH